MTCSRAITAVRAAKSGSQRAMAGNAEKVRIYPGGLAFGARINTSAGNSPQHATAIAQFRAKRLQEVKRNAGGARSSSASP